MRVTHSLRIVYGMIVAATATHATTVAAIAAAAIATPIASPTVNIVLIFVPYIISCES